MHNLIIKMCIGVVEQAYEKRVGIGFSELTTSDQSLIESTTSDHDCREQTANDQSATIAIPNDRRNDGPSMQRTIAHHQADFLGPNPAPMFSTVLIFLPGKQECLDLERDLLAHPTIIRSGYSKTFNTKTFNIKRDDPPLNSRFHTHWSMKSMKMCMS
jgi:hypothetical protein